MTIVLPKPQLFLIACCGMLGLFLLYEIFAPLPDVTVPTLPPRSGLAPARFQSPVSMPPLASLAIFNDRPIFSALRKPIVPAPIGGAATAPPPPPVAALVGVIIDAQRRIALIKSAGSPLAVALGIGESVEGWQLTLIEPDRVVLHQGSTDDEIKLEANRAISKPQPAAVKTTP
jgi:general secretion pathway protein N